MTYGSESECAILTTPQRPTTQRPYHVYKLRVVQLNFQSRHHVFLTSAYLLAAYYQNCYNTSGVSAHEYSRGAVRISFLASVEHEIYHAFKFFTVQFPVLCHHIG